MCISPLLLFHRFILRHEEDAYEVADKFILNPNSRIYSFFKYLVNDILA